MVCLRAWKQLKPKLTHLCQLPVHHLQHSEAVMHATGSLCGTSVQWHCISVLSLALGIPTWVLLQAPARGTRTVANAPRSLCKEELSRLGGVLVTWVGESSQRSEYVNSLVSLWPSVSSWNAMCSHSPSVFSPPDYWILSCCLSEMTLDCSGEWSPELPHSLVWTCLQLAPASFPFTPMQIESFHMNPSRCFNNTL